MWASSWVREGAGLALACALLWELGVLGTDPWSLSWMPVGRAHGGVSRAGQEGVGAGLWQVWGETAGVGMGCLEALRMLVPPVSTRACGRGPLGWELLLSGARHPGAENVSARAPLHGPPPRLSHEAPRGGREGQRSSGLAEKGRRGCGHSLQGSVRSLSLPSGVTAWRLSPGFSTRGDFAPRDIQSRQAPFQL